MREGAAHVVVPAAARRDELLELRHDLVPAAVARVVDAVAVVDFTAPVEAQHDVAHLAVCKVDHVVVDQHAVRRQREAEILVAFLFAAARVGDELLDDVEVHQRLAAEEIDLQIAAAARMLDQKVERLAADLERHDGAVAVVLALAREAVGAVEVAGVRHVQAQRLDDVRALLLERAGDRLKGVRREELAVRFELLDLVAAFENVLLGHVLAAAVFLEHRGADLRARARLIHADDVVGDLVHNVHRAGTDVQHNVEPAEFVAMYHSEKSFRIPVSVHEKCRQKAAFSAPHRSAICTGL